MIFHSFEYLLFFVAVLCVYWSLGLRLQNVFLLGASYVFYGYVHVWYCVLIAATTLIDYSCARAMVARPGRRKVFLVVSLVSNFSILCAFKYFNFFSENLTAIFSAAGLKVDGIAWTVLLPVGISFYTFQSASYVVDVYRGKLDARRDLVNYALFVSFFPQLVAGPIERAGRLLRRLEEKRTFDVNRLRSGLFLMLWGLFKKIVIADNVATFSNKAMSLDDPSFPIVWGGVFAFCIQIYADFSAYTDIARGTARTLGIDICRNFRHPYLALNPADFWSRWHISLSTWFRDYVYIPLGGNRCSEGRIWFNLMATFVLSGLWHGANWNFIIWGAYHGILLVLWRVVSRGRTGLLEPKSWMVKVPLWVGMFVLTNIGWLIFREQNPVYLWQFLTASPLSVEMADWRLGLYFFVATGVYSLPLWLHACLDRWVTGDECWEVRSRRWGWVIAQSVVGALLLIGILLLRTEVAGDFIYFQF